MGYFRQTITGISWTAAFQALFRVVTVVRVIIIARFFLTPYQFGLFGIATLVLSFLEVVTETGVNVYLIQTKNDISDYINSAWIVAILRGVVIGVVIFLLAAPISDFYNVPDATYLIMLIALVPFIKGFINPSVIKLQKELTFKKEFLLRSTLLFIESFVTILLAYSTRNPACFIYGFIVSAVLEVAITLLMIRPRPQLEFHKTKVMEIIHHGKWVTLYGMFNYFAQQGDNLVVGKVLGAAPLAIYQTGYKLSTLPVSEVTDVFSKVVFPVYTKMAHDKVRLLSAFLKVTAVITIGAISLGSVILLFPTQIVSLTLGDKWMGVAPILEILTIYGILRAISGSVSALFLAVGKQKYVTAMTFTRFFALAVTIVPLTVTYGLQGAGFSAFLSVLFEIPVILFYSRKVFA